MLLGMRIPRELDSHEVRVLGCLLEKQQATPEYYPMTLNSLTAACNQRSNRNPVFTVTEGEVGRALSRLIDEGLARRDDMGRSTKWSQKLDHRWGLDAGRKAALTVLLLRGPQTAGEVRSRTRRLHEFPSSSAAESALADLAGPPEPLVLLLERDPGQKEARWAHRLGGDKVESAAAPMARDPRPAPDFDPELVLRRLALLEQQVQELQAARDNKPGLFD
jgi:uncharacterized protein YceH (UPF0502 family)